MFTIPNTDVQRFFQRDQLPQIAGADHDSFMDFMNSHNVSCECGGLIPAGWLIPTQSEFNDAKIDAFVKSPNDISNSQIIVSRDFYILDGHHRAIAAFNISPNFLAKCMVFDCDINQLIQMGKEFDKSFVRSIDD